MGIVKNIKAAQEQTTKPSREEAEEAVRTLLRWAGENPTRPGLRETPGRVTRAYEEFFAGYDQSADELLCKTFEDIEGYNDFVLVKNIDFTSHCEHHMVPIIGRAHVAYWPDARIVGISKLARVVDVFAKRLVSQETMTRQIIDSIDRTLAPKGTAVMIDAVHHCMSIRGTAKAGASTITSQFSGIFEHDEKVRARFLENCR